MRSDEQQWIGYATSQLEAILSSEDVEGALYHGGVYLRAANKLIESEMYYKQNLGRELLEGYEIMIKNYNSLKEIMKK